MKRFVEGEDRRQGVLLPEYLDDYVSEANPVRVIDVFVDELDLGVLAFAGVVPEATGRPAYHPGLLLKIYVYGYINLIASSRRLEREAPRNVELMWLTGRLAPDFKTIADFRKDNGPAIRATCRRFIDLCRRLDLFTHAVAAIDGSKFKAVNARDKNFSKAKLKKRMDQVEASIERYMAALETADRQEGELAQAKSVRLQEKIAALGEQMAAFKALEPVVHAAPDQQVSLTDPDARSMATSGRGSGVVGYNVQAAVDAKHHLIVAHEVTDTGHDRDQLSGMAGQGGDGAPSSRCAGGPRLLRRRRGAGLRGHRCHALCAQAAHLRLQGQGTLRQAGLRLLGRRRRPSLPAGEALTRRFTSVENAMNLYVYWTPKCAGCPLKSQCTSGKERRIKRWEHEAAIDAMQERLDRRPDAMRIRRATVEHPFGTLKAWME